METFVTAVNTLPFNVEEASASALIRADLEKRGQPIGPYDILIAGTAMANGGTPVTHNVSEFARIENSQILLHIPNLKWVEIKVYHQVPDEIRLKLVQSGVITERLRGFDISVCIFQSSPRAKFINSCAAVRANSRKIVSIWCFKDP